MWFFANNHVVECSYYCSLAIRGELGDEWGDSWYILYWERKVDEGIFYLLKFFIGSLINSYFDSDTLCQKVRK